MFAGPTPGAELGRQGESHSPAPAQCSSKEEAHSARRETNASPVRTLGAPRLCQGTRALHFSLLPHQAGLGATGSTKLPAAQAKDNTRELGCPRELPLGQAVGRRSLGHSGGAVSTEWSRARSVLPGERSGLHPSKEMPLSKWAASLPPRGTRDGDRSPPVLRCEHQAWPRDRETASWDL